MTKLLTVKQLSERIGYSEGHIRNLVYRGEIPYMKLSRKALRFDPEKIEEWIKARAEQTRLEEHKPAVA